MKTQRKPLARLTKAYLEKFFKNKDLPFQEWQITLDGVTRIVTNDSVIASILKASHEEQRELADALIELDEAGRDINMFLKHLAVECNFFSKAQPIYHSSDHSELKAG